MTYIHQISVHLDFLSHIYPLLMYLRFKNHSLYSQMLNAHYKSLDTGHSELFSDENTTNDGQKNYTGENVNGK